MFKRLDVGKAQYLVGCKGSDERVAATGCVDDLPSHFCLVDAFHLQLFLLIIKREPLASQSDDNPHFRCDLAECSDRFFKTACTGKRQRLMLVQYQIVQTLHLASKLFHSESRQDAWMPEDGSSEAASFREDSPGDVSRWVDDDHHPAITEKILKLREHNVVAHQPSIRPEMRLHIVPTLLVNCNVSLSRLKLGQCLDRRRVHAVLFENRDLFLADLILPYTRQQGHFSLAEDSRGCNRDIPTFSSWDPVDFLHDHLFAGPGKPLDEEVDIPV